MWVSFIRSSRQVIVWECAVFVLEELYQHGKEEFH